MPELTEPRVQQALRGAVEQARDVVDAGAFTAYLHPFRDDPWVNYAIPREDATEADWPDGIRLLREAFAAHDRRPRLEFLPALAGGLEDALRATGFVEELRMPLLACTPATLRRPEVALGTALKVVDAGADAGRVRLLLATAALGFGSEPPTDADVERFAKTTADGFGVVAIADGVPAAAGQTSASASGLMELGGIATLPSFRRRGLAGAVTARLAQEAFARGIEGVFLTPGDEGAERIYARAGFARVTTLVSWVQRPART